MIQNIEFKSSKVEILPGKVGGSHGGPHVFRDGVCTCGAKNFHVDEIELMDEDTWNEIKKRKRNEETK